MHFSLLGRMFIAHIRRLGLDKNHIALIMDGHGSHVYNLPFVDDMYQNNISVAILESHTTHATQPMDQYPFESFKKHYNDNLEEWCANMKGIHSQSLHSSVSSSLHGKGYDSS